MCRSLLYPHQNPGHIVSCAEIVDIFPDQVQHILRFFPALRLGEQFKEKLFRQILVYPIAAQKKNCSAGNTDVEQRNLLLKYYRRLGYKNRIKLVAYAQGLADSEV